MMRLATTFGFLLLAPFGMAGCAAPACADGEQNPCVCTTRVGHPTGLQVCDGGEYEGVWGHLSEGGPEAVGLLEVHPHLSVGGALDGIEGERRS